MATSPKIIEENAGQQKKVDEYNSFRFIKEMKKVSLLSLERWFLPGVYE